MCWICSEHRSSCNVKSKALRASQLKENLDTFDIRAGSGLFFQGTRRSASQRVGGHEQLICNQNLFGESKDVNYCEYIYIYIWLHLLIYDELCPEEFRAKEMNRYEYDRLSDTSSISSVSFRRISSQGKKAHFATTGNVAVWNLSFLWFWLASCWIVGWCWMHILRPSKIPHVAVRGYLDGAILPCTSRSSPSCILPALHGVRWSLHMFWTFSAQIGTNARFMLSIDCAASFYLWHGTRLFEQFVEHKGIKLLN